MSITAWERLQVLRLRASDLDTSAMAGIQREYPVMPLYLHGLNLSRACSFRRFAERLPEGDKRISVLMEAAEQHAEAAMPYVSGSDYMVEHWLAAYAVLFLCERPVQGIARVSLE